MVDSLSKEGRGLFRAGVLRGVSVAVEKASRRTGERRASSSGRKAEHVVPVFTRRAQTLNGGMERQHPSRHGFSGGVEVKTTVNGVALLDEVSQPSWSGSCPRGGEAAKTRMERMAVNSRGQTVYSKTLRSSIRLNKVVLLSSGGRQLVRNIEPCYGVGPRVALREGRVTGLPANSARRRSPGCQPVDCARCVRVPPAHAPPEGTSPQPPPARRSRAPMFAAVRRSKPR